MVRLTIVLMKRRVVNMKTIITLVALGSLSFGMAHSFKELRDTKSEKCGEWVKKSRTHKFCIKERKGEVIDGFKVVSEKIFNISRSGK